MAKILFDHNSPPRLARALNTLIESDGHSAIALKDKFSPDIQDVEFFPVLGNEGNWIVITKDKSQTSKRGKKQAEREAILRTQIPTFYMSPSLGRMYITRQAAVILWQFPNILKKSEDSSHFLWELPVRDKGTSFKRR